MEDMRILGGSFSARGGGDECIWVAALRGTLQNVLGLSTKCFGAFDKMFRQNVSTISVGAFDKMSWDFRPNVSTKYFDNKCWNIRQIVPTKYFAKNVLGLRQNELGLSTQCFDKMCCAFDLAMLCYDMLCYSMLCYSKLCYANATLCYAMLVLML